MAKAKGRDTRQPWIKWYTRDWRADAPLRMCSFAARGLWADLISLMAESRAFGFLLVEGVIPSTKQLAGLLGGSEREVGRLMDELGEANVYSQTSKEGTSHLPDDIAALIPADMPGGVVFSRRMVRDKAKADKDRENGKGGGNPNLAPPDNHGVNPQANPQKSEVRSQNQISEAKASGAKAPARQVIFEEGLPWLVRRSGLDDRACRSIIGKWLKEYGDEPVLAAMQQAELENPVDPVPWIVAKFKPRETYEQRRIREGLAVIHAYEAEHDRH